MNKQSDGNLFPLVDESGVNGRRDFDNMTIKIVFTPGGDTSIPVYFPVLDDAVDEAQEGFIIVLDADEPLTMRSEVAFTRSLRTTLARINDDDRKQYNCTHNDLKC